MVHYAYIAIGVSASIITLVFVVLSFVRFKNRFIAYRSYLFLLGAITSGLIFSMNAVAMSLFAKLSVYQLLFINYVLYSVLAAVYVTRLLMMLDEFSFFFLKTTLLKNLVSVLVLLAISLFFIFPGIVFQRLQFEKWDLYICGMILFMQLIVILSIIIAYSYVGEIFRIKQEYLSVSILATVSWITVLVFSLLPKLEMAKRQAYTTYSFFAFSIALFYFSCILPVVCSYKVVKRESLVSRTKYISQMLLENEEMIDHELLSDNQCLESIFLFREVQKFISTRFSSKKGIQNDAKTIYDKFLSKEADLYISIPEEMRKNIVYRLNASDVNQKMFDDVLDYVWFHIIIPYTKLNGFKSKNGPKFSIPKLMSDFVLWS